MALWPAPDPLIHQSGEVTGVMKERVRGHDRTGQRHLVPSTFHPHLIPSIVGSTAGFGSSPGKPENDQWESGPAADEDRNLRFILSSKGRWVSRRSHGSFSEPWRDQLLRGPMSLGFQSQGGTPDSVSRCTRPHLINSLSVMRKKEVEVGIKGAGGGGREEGYNSLRPSLASTQTASLNQTEFHGVA